MESQIRNQKATSEFARIVLEECGENVNVCFQCKKCTCGCPVSYLMDYTPTQLVHAIRLGMEELVLNSKTIWLCASCETCSSRCPQELDLPKVMDVARIMVAKRGIKPGVPDIASFYKTAVSNIGLFGRMYEVGLIVSLKFKTKKFMKDTVVGMKMFLHRKLKLIPNISGASTSRGIFSRLRKLERGKK